MALTPSNIINGGSSVISKASSYLRSPTKLLLGTKLGFLANTTLNKMDKRADPVLSCLWTIALPTISYYEVQDDKDPGGLMDYLNVDMWKRKALGALTSLGTTAASATFDAIGGAIGMDKGTLFSKNISLGDQYVQGVELVFLEDDVISVRQRAELSYKYPGATSNLDDLVLNFYADVGNRSFAYIRNWMNLVHPPLNSVNYRSGANKKGMIYGGYSYPSMYKKTITIGLADENDTSLFLIDYIGCFPKSMGNITGDSDSNAVTYDVTFSVDDIMIYGFMSYDLADLGSDILGAGGKLLSGVADKAISGIGSAFGGSSGPSSSSSGSSSFPVN